MAQTPSPIILPEDGGTLFRMHTFNSAADIRDKGPNAIPVSNTGVTVGSNANGTFMQFSSGRFLTFVSSLLNRSNLEINVIIASPAVHSGYDGPILDTRPANTNGLYHILGLTYQSLPPKASVNYNVVTLQSTDAIEAFPAKLTMRVTGAGTELFINDVQQGSIPAATSFSSANLKVGRSAYYPIVDDLVADIYYIDVRDTTWVPPPPTNNAALKALINNQTQTGCFGYMADPDNLPEVATTNISSVLSNTVAVQGITGNPIHWLPTEDTNKLKLRVQVRCELNLGATTLEQFLANHNTLAFNNNLTNITLQGYLLLSVGPVGSGAEIILTEANMFGTVLRFTAFVDSKEFS